MPFRSHDTGWGQGRWLGLVQLSAGLSVGLQLLAARDTLASEAGASPRCPKSKSYIDVCCSATSLVHCTNCILFVSELNSQLVFSINMTSAQNNSRQQDRHVTFNAKLMLLSLISMLKCAVVFNSFELGPILSIFYMLSIPLYIRSLAQVYLSLLSARPLSPTPSAAEVCSQGSSCEV